MTTYTIPKDGSVREVTNAIEVLDPDQTWTVTIEPHHKRRTLSQNNLQYKWYAEVAKQQEQFTEEQIKGFSKLLIGVPILREENSEFRAKYDEHIKPMPYDSKFAVMMEPFNFPVTSLMDTAQESKYLDALYAHWTSKGFELTLPPPKTEQR